MECRFTSKLDSLVITTPKRDDKILVEMNKMPVYLNFPGSQGHHHSHISKKNGNMNCLHQAS
jgi:hypothetical protein